jgi:cytochrome P450
MRDVSFSDGTVVKKGKQLAFIGNHQVDPAYYQRPLEFDPYRFIKLREKPGEGNNHQFVSAHVSSMGFGLGKHTCPGRFFASNEMKVILCHLLLMYDIEATHQGRPAETPMGAEMVVNTSAKLKFRRRFDLEHILPTRPN